LIVACSLCSSSYELNGLQGDIPSALQPRPITAIFLRPYSRAPSRRYSFGLTAAPHHGDNRFFFAARQESISFRVIAAKSIFRLPRSRFCHRREVDF